MKLLANYKRYIEKKMGYARYKQARRKLTRASEKRVRLRQQGINKEFARAQKKHRKITRPLERRDRLRQQGINKEAARAQKKRQKLTRSLERSNRLRQQRINKEAARARKLMAQHGFKFRVTTLFSQLQKRWQQLTVVTPAIKRSRLISSTRGQHLLASNFSMAQVSSKQRGIHKIPATPKGKINRKKHNSSALLLHPPTQTFSISHPNSRSLFTNKLSNLVFSRQVKASCHKTKVLVKPKIQTSVPRPLLLNPPSFNSPPIQPRRPKSTLARRRRRKN